MNNQKQFLIIKAIQIGNINLAKKTFDTIVNDKADWCWLKFNLPYIIMKNCWYMLSEFGEFLEVKTLKPNDWKKFIIKLCLVNKTNEPINLYNTVSKENFSEDVLRHQEFILASNFDTHVYCVEDCKNYLNKDYNAYEKKALKIIYEKITNSNIYINKKYWLCTFVLFLYRNIDSGIIKRHIKLAINRYKKKGNKIKNNNKTPFYMVSENTVVDKPNCFEMMWGKWNQ